MTCKTSAVGVCCSNASRVSVKSRAFSIAITAWAAKFCNNADEQEGRKLIVGLQQCDANDLEPHLEALLDVVQANCAPYTRTRQTT